MAKRSTKPLYELMSTQRVRQTSGAAGAAETDDHDDGSRDDVHGGDGGRLARSVRIPMGWLLLATTGVGLLLLGAYALGFTLGGQAMREQLDAEFVERLNGSPAPAVVDPRLGRTTGAAGPARAGSDRPGDGLERDAARAAGSGDAASAPGGSGLGPVESDPRRRGQWYVHVVSTDRTRAVQVAEFCRAEGLAAYVVGSSPRAVIVTPGFDSSAAAAGMIARVKDVGELWIRERHGPTGFDTAYAKNYR